jgi:hypothetical protein
MNTIFFTEQNVNGEFDNDQIADMNKKANELLDSGKYDFITDDQDKIKAIMDEIWNG